LPGLVVALLCLVGLAELGYRLQAVRGGAAAGRVLGIAADPASPLWWLGALMLLVVGGWLLHRAAPLAHGAWQEVAAMAGVVRV
jgi:hypothetical protein